MWNTISVQESARERSRRSKKDVLIVLHIAMKPIFFIDKKEKLMVFIKGISTVIISWKISLCRCW